MKDRELFSNTSTVPMATCGIDGIAGREFTVVWQKKYDDDLVVYQCQMDNGALETVAQFSCENRRFLERADLPIHAKLRWDGWRYTLVAA